MIRRFGARERNDDGVLEADELPPELPGLLAKRYPDNQSYDDRAWVEHGCRAVFAVF